MTTASTWLAQTPREFQAVAAACWWPPAPETLQAALASPLDWDRFLAVVQRHRVAGLVHHALSLLPPGVVPPPAAEALKTAAFKTARNNIIAARSAADLTAQLAQAGIPAAVVKGASLGVLVYRTLALRHSKDVDLLVPEAAVEAADALLQQNGYRRVVPPADWTPEAARDFRIYRGHYEYQPTPTLPQIELHWRLQHNPHLGPSTYPPASWRKIDLGPGLAVHTLDEIDLLCYLCTHGASHAWSRLKWLADVAAMLRQNPTLTPRLLQRSREQGTRRAAEQALLLCRDLFDLPLPPGLRPGLAVQALARTARRVLTAGGGSSELPTHPLLLTRLHLARFLLSPSPHYLLTELKNEVLVPAAWQDTELSLPARLAAPLRRALRWRMPPRP